MAPPPSGQLPPDSAQIGVSPGTTFCVGSRHLPLVSYKSSSSECHILNSASFSTFHCHLSYLRNETQRPAPSAESWTLSLSSHSRCFPKPGLQVSLESVHYSPQYSSNSSFHHFLPGLTQQFRNGLPDTSLVPVPCILIYHTVATSVFCFCFLINKYKHILIMKRFQ